MYTIDLLNYHVSVGCTPAQAIERLHTDLGIKVRDYPEDGIVLLDYDQLNSPKTHPVVKECRSLILNRTTFEVVSRKFDRFFNYGEGETDNFDFEHAVLFEKADGSLIGVYHLNDKWNISTRGMAFAEGNHAFGGTFCDKVIDAFGCLDDANFQQHCRVTFDPRYTYVFEYTSPENRIVTKYVEPRMVLLAIVDHDGMELNIADCDLLATQMQQRCLNVRMVGVYGSGHSPDRIIHMASTLQDLEEGFVAYSTTTGKRIKFKSPTYLVAHSIRGNDVVPTNKNLLKLIMTGDADEFLAYFPEWESAINGVRQLVDAFCREADNAYDETRDITDQKTFALQVKDLPTGSLMFAARRNKTQMPSDAFRELDLVKQYRYIFGDK